MPYQSEPTPTCMVRICGSKKTPRTSRILSSTALTSPYHRKTHVQYGRPTIDIPVHPSSQETSIAAHFLTPEQLSKILETDLKNGLTEERAQELLDIYGPNTLEQKREFTMLNILIHNMFGWFPTMLWVGASMSIGIHFIQFVADSTHQSNENLYLGVIIIMVVVFTGLFAFYQEAKNVMVMRGFRDLIPGTANVIRDGKTKKVPSDDVVVGDIVEMAAGEIVPADVRLIRVNDFRIDMSSMTGEPEPQSRGIECTNENPMETKNLAFFSCLITDGEAVGVVVATGHQSVIGRIAGLVTDVEKEESPIAAEIKHFILILCVIACIFGGIFFILVTIIQGSWIAGFYYMTGIIVANVPEGLLVTLTIALTLTALKLQMKNCLVKKLQSVETLGAISCICSDKTGTLTQNRMSVSHLMYNMTIVDKEVELSTNDECQQAFFTSACLCLRAEFIETDPDLSIAQKHIKGDASESAVLYYMEIKNAATFIRKKNTKVCELPFNSRVKYQLSIHAVEATKSYHLYLKGAPEIIIEMCSTILLSKGEVPLGSNEKSTVRMLCIKLGQMGERVLGYCDLALPQSEYPWGYKFNSELKNFPMKNLRFLGLISLIDPPRASVPFAISKCRSAGIKVIMVTGDHPITALAISRKVGIMSPEFDTQYDKAFKLKEDPRVFNKTINRLEYSALVVTGDELRQMTIEELDILIERVPEITFARTSPQQKLLIVESCQRVGHVVGVTGDGVNDSPALKRADIGIAMGITGTDVSKQAADMILLDDDFSSIILGVEEGRLIFDNLKKSIAFTLTSNIPEMVPFILYATIGIPLPLHALLIICINVLTDLWPAISLAYEKSEADIMKKPPRDLVTQRLVNMNLITMAYFQVGVIQLMAAMTAYFVAMACHGFLPAALLFTRVDWNSASMNDFKDSYGQEWSYAERKHLEMLAQSTYYATIVLVQVSDVIICKTRRLSILQQGMMNHMLNFGIMLEVCISLIILYIPFFNAFLYTTPVPWPLWLSGLPYAFLIICVDETRKYLIRKYPGSWIEKELYW